MQWIDAHCHMGDEVARWPDAEETVAAAALVGVTRMVTVGCDLATSQTAIAVAQNFAGVWATAGVHPHDAKNTIAGIEALLGEEKVVAVGECGLDYFYDNSPRQEQKEVFAQQIQLAHAHDLALVVHTRDAWKDTLDILRAEKMPERTVIHCFSGGVDEARALLDLGAYLSFSGIVTFPKAPEVREAMIFCPLERLLIETDAPFLAPVPHRGKPNSPALLPVIGQSVADGKGLVVDAVAEVTWKNAETVYALTH